MAGKILNIFIRVQKISLLNQSIARGNQKVIIYPKGVFVSNLKRFKNCTIGVEHCN